MTHATNPKSTFDALMIRPMTAEQQEEQRRSWVAGNVGLSNPAVTRALVDQVANDNRPRVGNWLQTYTGGKFYPMDPRASELNIADIAHSLSMMCRYAGHCLRFYSVAEHSVLVARYLRDQGHGPAVVLKGLLHDATEAYLVDVPRPVKSSLIGYKAAEERIWKVIAYWGGMSEEMPEEVHEADNRILNDERAQNMAPCVDVWGYNGNPLGVTLKLWSPASAEAAFLDMFTEITGGTA